MSKILDPDGIVSYIVDGTPTTEVLQFNTTAKTIKLIEGGGFTFKDGVTGQCLFSKIKEVIKASSLLISVPLPVREMIHDESMELINGWTFADTNTLKAIRDCGVAYVNTSGTITNRFACFVTLGEVAAGTNVAADLYFVQSSATDATPQYFTHLNTGTTFGVNELVEITSADTYAKVFLRRAGYTFDESSNSDIGYPELTYKKYNFPITHGVDGGVTVDDTTLAGYTGMSITWYATAQSFSLGTNGPYDYHVVVGANGHTYDETYSWVQYQLRKSADIDAGAGNRVGKVASALVFMNGAVLTTIYQSGVGGVHIGSIAAASYNNVQERDDTNTLRSYPLSVAVECEFDSYLQGDVDSYFWVFPTSAYGTPGATPLLDSLGAQMKGAATSNTSFSYVHTVDVPVTGIALGLDGAKIATATGTITTSGTKLVFVAGLERWYNDPV